MDEYGFDNPTYRDNTYEDNRYDTDDKQADSQTVKSESHKKKKKRPSRSKTKTMNTYHVQRVLDTYDAFMQASDDERAMVAAICEVDPDPHTLTQTVLGRKIDTGPFETVADLAAETDDMTILYGLLGSDDRTNVWSVLRTFDVVSGSLPRNYQEAARELVAGVKTFGPDRAATLTAAISLCRGM